MKKLLICLMLIVLLGQLPLEIWNQGTPEQQQEFVKEIVQKWMKETNCPRAEVAVVSNGTWVYFFAECLKLKGDEI